MLRTPKVWDSVVVIKVKSGIRKEKAQCKHQDGVCSSPYDTEGQAAKGIQGRLQGPEKQKQGIIKIFLFQ